MTDQQPFDENEPDYRYDIRLLISHPSIDPARITSALGKTPSHSAIAGAPTRPGRPYFHRLSFWSYSYEVEGKRKFFSSFAETMDWLEPHRDFLADIVKDGGDITLIVNLPGDTNIGSTLSWRDMARLAALKIDLGVEVFPDMR